MENTSAILIAYCLLPRLIVTYRKRDLTYFLKNTPIPKPKKRSVSKLKKELDTLFSRYVRYSAVEADGMVPCYTCPNRNVPAKMQNGHFVPRQYLATRYDLTNNHPQDYACNMLYGGQPSAYAERLERDYGPGTVAALEARRRTVVPSFPYEHWIAHYKQKLAELGLG